MGCASGKSVTVSTSENGYEVPTGENPIITVSSPQPTDNSLKPPEVIIEGERPPSITPETEDNDVEPMNPFDESNGDSLDNTIREIQLSVPDTSPEAAEAEGDGGENAVEDGGEGAEEDQPIGDEDGQATTPADEEELPAEGEEIPVDEGEEIPVDEGEELQPAPGEDEEDPSKEENPDENESKMEEDQPPGPMVITAINEE